MFCVLWTVVRKYPQWWPCQLLACGIWRRVVWYFYQYFGKTGVGLQPLACWDCGFESHRAHECLSIVNVVCCQVEVSATSWSLVQMSPTDCRVSEYDLETLRMRRPWPALDRSTIEKNWISKVTCTLKMEIPSLAVTWLWQLVAFLSPARIEVNPRPVHMYLTVYQGQFFFTSNTWIFPVRITPPMLRSHPSQMLCEVKS
jgi:hypothetical protein